MDDSPETRFPSQGKATADSPAASKEFWNKLTGEKSMKWVEALAKVAAAGAIVSGAIIAKNYETKISAVSILAQREQAESAMRATMFSYLIAPIVGPLEGKTVPDLDRERVVVELLALNFHEYLLLKPLMVYVDDRLAAGTTCGMSEERIRYARKSLRWVAAKVVERETARLMNEFMWEEKSLKYPHTVLINIMEPGPTEIKKRDFSSPRNLVVGFNDLFEIRSPDGTYRLTIVFHAPDWYQQTFKVQITTEFLGLESSKAKHQGISIAPTFDFKLTRFDFPFVDNTLLANGNRFAIVMRNIFDGGSQHSLVLRFIWFPKDYSLSRERPTNYGEWKRFIGKLEEIHG
jgi:hypothetical protein